ncbi:MAG: hypothetical protein GY757_52190, partial [bacterium]|nr:hypothetical protein [bacterium]
IRLIVDSNRFNNESLELGGPESLSIEEFMKKIAVARNKKEPTVFHLPLGLIVFFLSILERVVYGLLPLTVGQLASFRNDGSAAANSLMKKSAPLMKSIDDIISAGLESDSPAVDIPVALQKECRVFCKYLVKAPPDSYVLEKYNDCHTKLDFSPVDFHDALLIKLAGSMPLFTRMTDAYSRFFRPTSAVRKKLAYLVAILETSPHHFRYFESVDCKGFFGFLVKAGIKGVGLAFHLLFSFLLLFPLQMVAKVYGKKPGAVES